MSPTATHKVTAREARNLIRNKPDRATFFRLAKAGDTLFTNAEAEAALIETAMVTDVDTLQFVDFTIWIGKNMAGLLVDPDEQVEIEEYR